MIITLTFAYTISPIPVKAKEAETLGELKQELAALKKQKADNEANQKNTQNQIKAKENAIVTAESDISQAQSDIETAESNIEDSNAKLKSLTEQTKKVLEFTQQMKSKNAYVEYMSGATSMTDLIMRINMIEQTTESAQNMLEELEKLIEENEQLKVDLQKKQQDLSAKITSYQAKIQELHGDLESYDKFELDIDSKIKVKQDQVNNYVRLSKQKFGKEVDTATLAELDVVAYNGNWLKPLKKGRITSTIGSRWGSYHNALDIGGNPEGTPIYAAASGTVSGFIPRYKCGGNMVYINVIVGGQKYTTYYYHLLKVNVKVGDVVNQNTIIGTVGGYSTSSSHGGYDSCTTGAHLHFGVAKGYFTGTIKRANVITPPGFPNRTGYTFSSRTDYYG